MKDERCVRFLQWALPRIRMRWPGFRRVRGQVCKRIDRRIKTLGLACVGEYQDYLQSHPEEWAALDSLCRVTISRFGRDRSVFATLADTVLPALAGNLATRGDETLCVWSVGCASGEEPYTVAILWHTRVRQAFPGTTLDVTATDSDTTMLQRATEARYTAGSLKELPHDLRDRVFSRQDGTYRLDAACRAGVTFLEQDIREGQPDGCFDLVLCRNLVFTYFDDGLQSGILGRIVNAMADGAALVIGIHENLPGGSERLEPWFPKQRIYRKAPARRHAQPS